MPTSAQKIPNNPLNGKEVREVALAETERLISQLSTNLREALTRESERNALFSTQYVHPRVKIEVICKLHWSNINLPKSELSADAATETEPHAKDPDHHIGAVTREVTIDNPNLTRAHYRLPVEVTNVRRPGPTETFGSIENITIPVEPGEYPDPTPPKDTDISDTVAKQKGIPKERRVGRKE